MSLASLVFGVGSLIIALIATAPFLGLLLVIGLPFSLIGLLLGLSGTFLSVRRRFAADRDPEDPNLRYALSGLGLSLVSGLWMGFCVLVKGFAL